MLDRHHRPPPAHPALPTGWNNRDQIHSPLKGTGMICTITSANWPFGNNNQYHIFDYLQDILGYYRATHITSNNDKDYSFNLAL